MKANKLCVIDLASIIESISGCDPIESPTDQKLLPGVKDAIDRLKSDGWHLAIVSNQGACDFTDFPAWCLMPEHRFKVDWPRCHPDMVFTVLNKTIRDDLKFNIETENTIFVASEEDSNSVKVQYKTIENAIEEVTFAADLCGIEEAYFAPTINGDLCYRVRKVNGAWTSITIAESPDLSGFRLPDTGMLTLAEIGARDFLDGQIDRLMIGNQNSIQAAAKAGFRYMSAQEFCVSQNCTGWDEVNALSLKVGQIFRLLDESDNFPFSDGFRVTFIERKIYHGLGEIVRIATFPSFSFSFGEGNRVLVPPQNPTPQ